MTVGNFLKTKTQVGELCIITDTGWIVAAAYIDHEDLFRLPSTTYNLTYINDEWKDFDITIADGSKQTIKAHFVHGEYN